MKVTEQLAEEPLPERMQVGLPKLPGRLLVNVTVPVGVDVTVPVSLTVAVQVVGEPEWTGEGAHLMEVVVADSNWRTLLLPSSVTQTLPKGSTATPYG